MIHNRISGREFFKALEAAGIDCTDCRRIVIDVPYNGIVTIYREDINGGKFLKINFPPLNGQMLEVERLPVGTLDASAGLDPYAYHRRK